VLSKGGLGIDWNELEIPSDISGADPDWELLKASWSFDEWGPAHLVFGATTPVWSICNEKNTTQYHVGNETIDLSVISGGQVFHHGSIGDYETLWLFKDECYVHKLI